MLEFLIPAAASLGASFLGQSASKSNAQAQIQATAAANAANLEQARENNRIAQENAIRQENLQREFAQSGIQWKVEDAHKAGVHPLYALGAQTTSYAPQTVGMSAADIRPEFAPKSTDFSGLANAGQFLGRAVHASSTNNSAQTAILASLQQTQLEGAKLDNDIKRAELASRLQTVAATATPSMPTAAPSPFDFFGGVSGDATRLSGPTIKVETRRDVTDPNSPGFIPGAGPGVGLMRNTTGGYDPVMPPEMAESLESDMGGRIAWLIRNRLLPNIGLSEVPNAHDPGLEMVWSRKLQQWEVAPKVPARFGYGSRYGITTRTGVE